MKIIKIQKWMMLGLVLVFLAGINQGCCTLLNIGCSESTSLNVTTNDIKAWALQQRVDKFKEQGVSPSEYADTLEELKQLLLVLPRPPKPCECPPPDLRKLLIYQEQTILVRDIQNNKVLLEGKAGNTLIRDGFYNFRLINGQFGFPTSGKIGVDLMENGKTYTATYN